MASPTDSLEDVSFEDVTARLEAVVERLEKGELPLDESLSIFEEGVRLARVGSLRLEEAEHRLDELLQQNFTRPLEDA